MLKALRKLAADSCEIDRPRCLPNRLAIGFVQGDNVLLIAAINVEDQQVSHGGQRRARPHFVVTIEVAAGPEHLAGFGVQAGGAVGAEMDIEAASLDDRGGRGVGVARIYRVNLLAIKHLDIMQHLAPVAINADGEHFQAVGTGRG